jgi:hypothetical protein
MGEPTKALQDELVSLLNLIDVERKAGQGALVEILTEKAARCLVALAETDVKDEYPAGEGPPERF